PIEESYAILQLRDINIPREDIERADSLRYRWEKLQMRCTEVTSKLLEIQPQYRSDLLENVKL
ncbi:unnamed protein product, partial [Rotaria magnacalcarata]